jgi:hypothetical protein
MPPTFKSGDWICSGCGSHNYADKTECFRCSGEKADCAREDCVSGTDGQGRRENAKWVSKWSKKGQGQCAAIQTGHWVVQKEEAAGNGHGKGKQKRQIAKFTESRVIREQG